MNLKQGARRSIFAENDAMNYLLILAGYLLAFGFLFGEPENNPNYALMLWTAPKWLWAIGFVIYSSVKLYGTCRRLPFWFRLSVVLTASYCWAYMLLSFTLMDPTPLAPTEVLLAMPLLTEIWYAATILYKRNNCRRNTRAK